MYIHTYIILLPSPSPSPPPPTALVTSLSGPWLTLANSSMGCHTCSQVHNYLSTGCSDNISRSLFFTEIFIVFAVVSDRDGRESVRSEGTVRVYTSMCTGTQSQSCIL